MGNLCLKGQLKLYLIKPTVPKFKSRYGNTQILPHFKTEFDRLFPYEINNDPNTKRNSTIVVY
jgi:hypothetical protein